MFFRSPRSLVVVVVFFSFHLLLCFILCSRFLSVWWLRVAVHFPWGHVLFLGSITWHYSHAYIFSQWCLFKRLISVHFSTIVIPHLTIPLIFPLLFTTCMRHQKRLFKYFFSVYSSCADLCISSQVIFEAGPNRQDRTVHTVYGAYLSHQFSPTNSESSHPISILCMCTSLFDCRRRRRSVCQVTTPFPTHTQEYNKRVGFSVGVGDGGVCVRAWGRRVAH